MGKTAPIELNNGYLDLTFGTGAYTLDLDPNVTTSAATYSITGMWFILG